MADDTSLQADSVRANAQDMPAVPAHAVAPDAPTSPEPSADSAKSARPVPDVERFKAFKARSALRAAALEAQALNAPSVTTAHLFIGLVDGGISVAGRVLRAHNIRLERARRALRNLDSREQTADAAGIGLTREGRRAAEHAVDRARGLGHHHIGTEHLLLGLLDVDGDARALLLRLRLDPKRLQEYTLATIRGEPLPAAPRTRNPLARLASLLTRSRS